MLQTAVACLALAGAAIAQSSPSTPSLKPRPASPAKAQGSSAATSPAPGAAASSEASSVAPDAAVITIQGLCEKRGGGSGTPADCKTVITRAEFEKVVNAVQPNMPPAAKKQFANRYVAALYLAEKAHELGLDKGPTFEQKMYIARLQILASLGGEQVHQEAAKVTDGEIESYYHDHIADYKTISYDRLYIPKQKQVDPSAQKPNDPDLQKKREASEAEMKAEADKLRARAAAGEDFAKLQQEAYDFGGYTQIKGSNPRVDKVRKAGIPPADASIFELKVGDVSQVFNDPSGFVVYKIQAVEDVSVASVHDEISRKLATEREKGAMESLQNSTKLDDAYFATPAPTAPPTLRNPGEAPPTPAPGKK
jgi:PPIC-type PPIASE domain